MSSFRSLAEKMRKEAVPIYDNNDRNVFEAAVLEIAHALRRGRKPTSCSVLTCENIQEWLHRTFVETHPYYHDHMSEECSLADDVADVLYGWYYGNPDAMAIIRAIALCRKYIRPRKLPKEVRGDIDYQERNKVTNRKRKATWMRNKMGSCYDDDFDHGGLIDLSFANSDSDPFHFFYRRPEELIFSIPMTRSLPDPPIVLTEDEAREYRNSRARESQLTDEFPESHLD